jgi:hypothetical protein
MRYWRWVTSLPGAGSVVVGVVVGDVGRGGGVGCVDGVDRGRGRRKTCRVSVGATIVCVVGVAVEASGAIDEVMAVVTWAVVTRAAGTAARGSSHPPNTTRADPTMHAATRHPII